MDIKNTFINLTSRTYPHGTEEDIFNLLPQDLETDKHGNLYKKIGEGSTMFACHLDTATSALTDITHIIEGDIIKTNGKSILGADDKAGVTILLYMIENNIPGLYYFFMGEEVGCVGSKKLADELKLKKIEGINKVISFDRRGTTSVITYQFGSRCCSDEFGTALSKALNSNDNTFNYKNDPTGLYTDSAQFVKIYPECTNISVGYWSEHTFSECQNIKHLEKLCKACININWESLPIKRDPNTIESEKDDYYGWEFGHSDGYGMNDYVYQPKPKNDEKKQSLWWFDDKTYNYWSSITLEKNTYNIIDIDLSNKRIDEEKILIEQLLDSLDVEFVNFTWNGLKLSLNYLDKHTSKCDRSELSDFLPELDFWKDYINIT